MAHKHKKKRRGCTFDMNSISAVDYEELTLLYTQLNAVMILVYSDLMYYFAVIAAFNEITIKNENQRDDFESDRLLVNFSISGLLVYIYISIINIRRYNDLRLRKAVGDVRFSLIPNVFLIIGSILEIAVYSYFYKGSNEFLYRDINKFSFVDGNNIGEVLTLLNMQKNAVILRFYGDYFFLKTTLEGIAVVMKRYDSRLEEAELPNPDISALNGQVLYTISRMIIAQATVKHYSIVADSIIRNSEEEDFISGEVSAVIGNYYGIISTVFLYIGLYKIYERNTIQPVFIG